MMTTAADVTTPPPVYYGGGVPLLPLGTLPLESARERCIYCHRLKPVRFSPDHGREVPDSHARCDDCHRVYMRALDEHLAAPGGCAGPPFYAEDFPTIEPDARPPRPLTGPRIYNGGKRRATLISGDPANPPPPR